MKRREKGFIGLQVLLVTATIGIASMVAVPKYQTFSERAAVAEALTLAGDLQRKLAQRFMVTGNFPTTNRHTSAIISPRLAKPDFIRDMSIRPDRTGQTVIIKVQLRDGVVKNPTGDMQYVQIAGTMSSTDHDSIEWHCSAAGVRPELLPDGCRG
jgi:type II secretory pathway pseudopilin PulG